MSETINELYLKYVNSVGQSLEDDRYFRYLFEIIQAGENVLRQNRQVLHKVVDEAWLSIIEDTLDSINTIIEKPRRFVNRVEEVVPVALARKISADSVRHLSMNTQFIASNENDDIQPTRILNVSTEDSFDLYENRFIYHLIQKLVTFIDKRTDVIFWSTGDEIRNTMSLESKIDDAYEEIEYKIEMKIKNRQSFAENDADNMDVFMRIDRVRRLTMALRMSSFCELMAGCAKVHSPIQRTNLLMKDPDYRKCYNLWQFLERYDSVGYTIEEQNTAVEFDEEYLLQMYINLINNYVVFKSLSEEEPRNLEEAALVQHQKLEPKFVKEIHEEIVDDYNIPDVEIRQVIIEEVTQAQLDAEARAAEEKALREAAEAARAQAEAAAEEAFAQSQQYMQMMMDAQDRAVLAESEKASAEAAAEEAETARLAAEEEARMVKASAEAQVRETRERAERDCTEAAKRAEESRLAMLEAQTAREKAQKEHAEMAAALSDAQASEQSALAAQHQAQTQAEAYRLAGEQSQAAYLDADARASSLSGRLDEALDTNNRYAAAIKRLEKELAEARTAQTQAEAKARRAAAARREAESIRAAAEKKNETLQRSLSRMEQEQKSERLAAQQQMQQLTEQYTRQEQENQEKLSKALRDLERAQKRRRGIFGKAPAEEIETEG